MSFPPPGRVWLKVTAVIPYPLPGAAAAAPSYRQLGLCFTPFLFLGILCSIKPSACNTAGRAPRRSSRLPFLSASCMPWDLTLALLLLCPYCVQLHESTGMAGVEEVQASPFVSGPFLSPSSSKGVQAMSTLFLREESPRRVMGPSERVPSRGGWLHPPWQSRKAWEARPR